MPRLMLDDELYAALEREAVGEDRSPTRQLNAILRQRYGAEVGRAVEQVSHNGAPNDIWAPKLNNTLKPSLQRQVGEKDWEYKERMAMEERAAAQQQPKSETAAEYLARTAAEERMDREAREARRLARQANPDEELNPFEQGE